MLQDPTLINPGTGLPFNGLIDTSLPGVADTETLAAGALVSRSDAATRDCIGGLICKAQLMQTYGLNATQAANFFKGPITIRMGVRGAATWASNASIFYGTRLTGDHN